ncbi:MAG: hypothetical protein ACR2P0_19300, partial [Acidimicrobiales bacterium]
EAADSEPVEDSPAAEDTPDPTATPDGGEESPAGAGDTESAADADESSSEPDDDGADQNPNLAKVVQLDRARADVDTGSHPAAGRGEPAASSTPSRPIAAVADVPDDGEVEEANSEGDGDRVEDLFARMRSNRDDQPVETEASAVVVEGANDESAAISPEEEAAVLEASTELSRRLKRVLADEQSDVMSSLKGAKAAPALDDLMGPADAHRSRWWGEVEPAAVAAFAAAAGKKPKNSAVANLRSETDEVVDALRRRVGVALTDGGDDVDGIVDGLRSIYREVKTQRIGLHAESVCQMAAEIGGGRTDDTA